MKPVIALGCLMLAVPNPSFGEGDRNNDPASWKPIPIPGEQKAPEFEDITMWINSKPLTMTALKGKVVVVHFMTFG
jgi:hypothetical protein